MLEYDRFMLGNCGFEEAWELWGLKLMVFAGIGVRVFFF
jgi:hypothetical protein